MESTGHERIISRSIGKHYQLGTGNGITVTGQLGCPLDYLAHFPDSIHIDAGLGRAYIYRRAYEIGSSESLRNGLDEGTVAGSEALLYQSREAADEVDADFLCCTIHRLSDRHEAVSLAGLGSNSNGGNGHALVDDRNTVFCLNILAGLHQEFGGGCNLVIDILTELGNIGMCAVTERDTHSNSTDIKLVLRNHAVCFKNIIDCQHSLPPQILCMAVKMSAC